MFEWTLPLLQEAPSLAIMAALVYLLNRSMEKRDARFLEYMQARDKLFTDSMRTMGDECHEVQRDAIETMKTNAAAISAAATLLAAHESK